MKPTKNTIQSPSKKQQYVIWFIILIGVLATLNFLFWFFKPEFIGNTLLFILLSLLMLFGIGNRLYTWYYYSNIHIDEVPVNEYSPTVDIFTTYYPGEPKEMTVQTLVAIQRIDYPHKTYLCDEADDPYLKMICEKLEVNHVTRTNKINAKAGNINNALRQSSGELCVILDPDHIPRQEFLDTIIPFFNDEEIGFVQIVQAYYNTRESLVAKGAAQQTFQFYGPMMMTMNGYGTVNAIGANCTFRRKALESIGGHAPGLAEDMHTAMLLYAQGWKSVYVPKILAWGLVPSTLTAYYKQQIKWSRGTFDLLFTVYPKIFKKLSRRQRFHFALGPLHYLNGLFYLLGFAIPVIALVFSVTPWKGDILFFISIIAPVVLSSVFLRIYIQKWVIQSEERGFHILGGILQIISWWVFLLGFIYTLLGKKIPYLPTPKEDDAENNLLIIIPNLIIAAISIFAVVYGLYRDFTPYSIIMAFFALVTTIFMLFSVYLAIGKTNKNRYIRNRLKYHVLIYLGKIRLKLKKSLDVFHSFLTGRIIPVFTMLILLSWVTFQALSTTLFNPDTIDKSKNYTSKRLLGIFYPTLNDGRSGIASINSLEKEQNLDFNIISLYAAWGDQSEDLPWLKDLKQISSQNKIAMLTWEPWVSTFKRSDTTETLKNEQKGLAAIEKGLFDSYIRRVAQKMKSIESPIYLRFAHEFDNPAYPWSQSGMNTPEEFKSAWKHVYAIFKEEGASNVHWIWNPWKSENLKEYYPGDDFVDWIGITGLNYSIPKNGQARNQSFKKIFKPFKTELLEITSKPIIIAEFGSLGVEKERENWVENALDFIEKESSIRAVVFFNSNKDINIPNQLNTTSPLDWTISNWNFLENKSLYGIPNYAFQNTTVNSFNLNPVVLDQTTLENVLGVAYKKGQNWKRNFYSATRETLEDDFAKIKELNLNTIRIEGPSIFDYNQIQMAKEYGLKIYYSFWIPDNLNFVTQKDEAKILKETILKTIKKYGNENQIIAWNIGNDKFYEINHSSVEPLSTVQREAYFLWLYDLLSDITNLDVKRPVSLDLFLDTSTIQTIDENSLNKFKNLNYNLVIKDTLGLQDFRSFAQDQKLLYQFGNCSTEAIRQISDHHLNDFVILSNFQDQKALDKISFNGLIDHLGNLKLESRELEKIGLQTPFFNDTSINTISILKPALSVIPGSQLHFKAVIQKNAKWILASNLPNTEDLKFEWQLIQFDEYDNPIQMESISNHADCLLEVPKNYKDYKLNLIVSKNGFSKSYKTALNLKLR